MFVVTVLLEVVAGAVDDVGGWVESACKIGEIIGMLLFQAVFKP